MKHMKKQENIAQSTQQKISPENNPNEMEVWITNNSK